MAIVGCRTEAGTPYSAAYQLAVHSGSQAILTKHLSACLLQQSQQYTIKVLNTVLHTSRVLTLEQHFNSNEKNKLLYKLIEQFLIILLIAYGRSTQNLPNVC